MNHTQHSGAGSTGSRPVLFYIVFTLAAAALIFSGCAPVVTKVSLYISPEARETLLAAGVNPVSPDDDHHPAADLISGIGDGWSISLVDDASTADLLIEKRDVAWNQSATAPGSLRRVEISGIPVIPTADWNSRISDSDIPGLMKTPLPEGIELSRADALTDGRRGLTVNGLYPDDPEYPLIDRTFLEFKYGPAMPEYNGSRSVVRIWKNIADLASVLGRRLGESLETAKTDGDLPGVDRVVWVASTGDVITTRGVEPQMFSGGGLEKTFKGFLPVLQNADITTGNLEGSVTTSSAKTPKSYNFKFSPAVVSRLKEAGYDYVMITNNHSYDYGLQGFLDTMKNLAAGGMGYSGGGSNLADAVKPWITEVKGKTFAIYALGFYPTERTGFNGAVTAAAGEDKAGILWGKEAHLGLLEKSMEETRADYKIVLVHGGHEYQPVPTAGQEDLYRRLVDMGADAVFGSHPHVLQGMEAYHHGVIFYSLGNFLFPGMAGMTNAEQTLVPVVGFYRGRPLYLKLYPGNLSTTTVDREASGEGESPILDRFYSLRIPDYS